MAAAGGSEVMTGWKSAPACRLRGRIEKLDQLVAARSPALTCGYGPDPGRARPGLTGDWFGSATAITSPCRFTGHRRPVSYCPCPVDYGSSPDRSVTSFRYGPKQFSWQAYRVRTIATAALLMVAISVGGCGGGHADTRAEPPSGLPPSDISVSSPEFSEGGQLPDRYTCHGAGLPPPLRWSGVPPAAAAVAVTVTDPDAPSGTYTHWVLFDLPPTVHGLAAGSIPPQARQATNSAGTIGYTPPCPPSGTHHYRFTVIGLRDRIELPDGAPLDQAIQQIQTAALARGTLVATVTHA
jgi:Raf kinase inhibitor-like YbhB/YbcL family protein